MHKRWMKIAAVIVAVFVAIVVIVPFLVNADTFRPRLQTQLSSAIGRQVTLGHLGFSLLRGSLVAENISISDDPAYSTSPFLQAKSLYIGVELGPLLFHHQVEITRITIDAPSIHLIHAQNGKWNFSSIGGAAASQSTSEESSIPNLTIGEVSIKDGSATVSTLPSVSKPLEYTHIDFSAESLALEQSFPFKLSASLPGTGTLQLSGDAGPLARKDASDTPFRASLQVKHFDPVAAGLVQPNQGISMIVDVDAQAASDGTTLTSTGKAQAANLQLSRTGSPAPQPVNIDYTISDDLDAQSGHVSDIAVHTGSVVAHVNGTYQRRPGTVILDLRLAAPNLPIDQLEALLPAVGVHLPSGSSLRGGTLTTNLSITGPATATTIAGPVEIDNTQLAGFDLGSKIQGLNGLSGTSGGTQIQTVRTSVNSSPQQTQFNNIYASVPSIGTATGSGTVSPSGDLNFNLVATFSNTSVVGSMANQAVNTVSNFIGGFLHPNSKPAPANTSRGIPLTITGTASNPSIRANLRAMLK